MRIYIRGIFIIALVFTSAIATNAIGAFLSDAETGVSDCSRLKKRYLHGNLMDNSNTLKQSMLNKRRTIYIITNDYLLGEDVTIPDGCILQFEGGSIRGTQVLTGEKTVLKGDVKCFVPVAGTFANDYLDITWFGATGDDETDNTAVISNVIETGRNSKADVFIPEGVFALKNGKISLGLRSVDINGDFVNTNLYADYNGIRIYGTGEESVIKSYYNGDVLNMSWLKNLHIDNLNVTSGIGKDNLPANNGQNLISLIDCENVSIKNCYCHDSYWKPRMSGNTVFCDGGSGITIQGRLFHNIVVSDCRIYNCMRGFDIVTTKWFVNDPLSSVSVSNIQVEKCFNGIVVANNFGYDGGLSGISDKKLTGSLIHLQGKTIDCKVGNVLTLCEGLHAELSNTSSLSIEQSLTSGYEESWLKDLDVNGTVDNKSVCASNISAPKNCEISIVSSYKNVTSGYVVDMNDTNNGVGRIADSNSIKLKLNEDCIKHDIVIKGKKTRGYLLNMYSTKGSAIKNSKLTVEGCSSSVKSDSSLFEKKAGENTICEIR